MGQGSKEITEKPSTRKWCLNTKCTDFEERAEQLKEKLRGFRCSWQCKRKEYVGVVEFSTASRSSASVPIISSTANTRSRLSLLPKRAYGKIYTAALGLSSSRTPTLPLPSPQALPLRDRNRAAPLQGFNDLQLRYATHYAEANVSPPSAVA